MKFGYTIIYVANVLETLAFYEVAFGIEQRFIHESELYGELETGGTVLAFAGHEVAQMNGFEIIANTPSAKPAGWEICLVTEHVGEAYIRAVEAGCTAVTSPEEKPWGQTVSYVRDNNGCLVEIASPVQTPPT